MAPVTAASLLRTLVLAAERAANMAQIFREDDELLQLLVEEKPDRAKGAGTVADFKTLADVLMQHSIVDTVLTEFPSLVHHVFGEEDAASLTGADGTVLPLTIGASPSATAALLKAVMPQNPGVAQKMADALHSDLDLSGVDKKMQVVQGEFELDNLALWIDPLDCTSAYITGGAGKITRGVLSSSGLRAVTVLVGCYDRVTGEAVAGVVHQPFCTVATPADLEVLPMGRCMWGATPAGVPSSWGVVTVPPTTCRRQSYSRRRESVGQRILSSPAGSSKSGTIVFHERASASLKFCGLPEGFTESGETTCAIVHSKHETAELLGRLGKLGSLIPCPGAGYKLLTVIDGLAAAYVCTMDSTCKWDTCAAHAILRAMGGDIVVSASGRPLRYHEPDHPDLLSGELRGTNLGGLIAVRDAALIPAFCAVLASNATVGALAAADLVA